MTIMMIYGLFFFFGSFSRAIRHPFRDLTCFLYDLYDGM